MKWGARLIDVDEFVEAEQGEAGFGQSLLEVGGSRLGGGIEEGELVLVVGGEALVFQRTRAMVPARFQ